MSWWEWTWSFIWWTFEVFIFVAAIFLIFVPVIAALVYIIARGRGMAERSAARQVHQAPEDDSYAPKASSSPTDDIASAKALLDSGAISQGEFDALKSKALGNKFYG